MKVWEQVEDNQDSGGIYELALSFQGWLTFSFLKDREWHHYGG